MTSHYPSIDIYEQSFIDLYESAWARVYDNSEYMISDIYSAMYFMYSNGKLRTARVLDYWYEHSFKTFTPIAWMEYLYYHRRGSRKRVKTILPKLDEYFVNMKGETERDILIMAINYMYAGALAEIASDHHKAFVYNQMYYKVKNKLWDISPQYTHYAMIAEFPCTDKPIPLPQSSTEFFLAIKALEKQGRYAEARGHVLRKLYDCVDTRNYDPLLTIALMIENALGVNISTRRKSIHWILPEFEHIGIYDIKTHSDDISFRLYRGRHDKCSIVIDASQLTYLTFDIGGFKKRTLSIPFGKCSMFLEEDK